MNMKRSHLSHVLVISSLVMSVAVGSRNAAAQAKAGLSSQQNAALHLAWNNLHRGYSDLLSTPPDTKGDTSKLEGHMKAAINALHEVDPNAVPAAEANIPVEDKGHPRQFILDAVRGHLDKARSVLNGAKLTNPRVQEALQNIAVAENDLTELGPAKK